MQPVLLVGSNSEATVREVAPNLAPPPGNPRFPLFDSLRAIAALCVFLGHTMVLTLVVPPSSWLFLPAVQLADQGVAIFFLISGFLLYRPFVAARFGGRQLSVGGYARRRLLRIVPAYWVALSVFVILGFVNGVTSHNWWIFYGFYQIYDPATIGHGIPVAWTLCIEMTFYAVLPIFALVAAKLGHTRRSLIVEGLLLMALAAASLAYRHHFDAFSSYSKVSTLPGTFTWFALGMGLAVLSVAETTRLSPSPVARFVTRKPELCWVIAIALGTLSYGLSRLAKGPGQRLEGHVLFGLVALFVLLPAVFGDRSGGLPRRVLRTPALVWIGLVSYAFYLYHTIVIVQVNKLPGRLDPFERWVFVLVVAFVITCLCSAASYYVVERPFMRLRFRGGVASLSGERS